MHDRQPENTVSLSESTLGPTLLRQILSPQQTERESGIDALLEIVRELSPLKQRDFLLYLQRDSTFRDSPWLKDALEELTEYLPNPKGMQAEIDAFNLARSVRYNGSKENNIKGINELKTELQQAQERHDTHEIKRLKSEIKRLAKEVKELAKEYKKTVAEFYNKTKEKTFNNALNTLCAHLKDEIGGLDQVKKAVFWEEALHKIVPLSFYNSPLYAINNPNPSKLALASVFEKDPRIGNALYILPKMGGANDPGEHGGIYLKCYQTPDGKIHSQRIFFKQATDDGLSNHRENIAEVIAGRKMNAIIGENAAPTLFALAPNGEKGNIEDVYVGSIMYSPFKDIHKAAHEAEFAALGKDFKDVPNRAAGMRGGQYIDRGNPDFRPGLARLIKGGERIDEKGQKQHVPGIPEGSLAKALLASVLEGNNQIHTENVGITTLASGKKEFVILDFGGAYRRPFVTKVQPKLKLLTSKEKRHGRFAKMVAPDSANGKKYRACYFLAYAPLNKAHSDDFLAAADFVTHFSRAELIKKSNAEIDYAVAFCGEKSYVEHFAEKLDTQSAVKITSANQAKVFMAHTSIARQFSLQADVLRWKLEKRKLEKTHPEISEEMLSDHPVYFAALRGFGDETKHIDIGESFLAPHVAPDIRKTTLFFLKRLQELSFDLQNLQPSDMESKRGDNEQYKIDKQNMQRDMLQETEVLEAYLRKAVSEYDFASEEDRVVLIQACDASYRQIVSAYQAFPRLNVEKAERIVRARLNEPQGLLASDSPTPELKNIVLSHDKNEASPFLDAKIALLNDSDLAPEMNKIFTRLKSEGDKDTLRDALTELGAKPTDARVNALFAENQLHRLFRELDAKGIMYSAKDAHQECFHRFESAANLAAADKIIHDYPRELQENEKRLQNDYLSKLIAGGEIFLRFLESLPDDKPLPAFITQRDLIAHLNSRMWKKPLIAERILLGRNEAEKEEGSKLVVSIFTHTQGSPAFAAEMHIADSHLRLVPSAKWHVEKDNINALKNSLYHFLQQKIAEGATAAKPDANMPAIKSMHDQVLSILQQRWTYIEGILDLPPESRPSESIFDLPLEAKERARQPIVFQELLDSVRSLFLSPPLPDFISPSSLFKLINCYPSSMITMLEQQNKSLNGLFTGDKEEGRHFAIRLLTDVHEQLVTKAVSDIKHAEAGKFEIEHKPTSHDHLNKLPSSAPHVMLFQAQLLQGVLENNSFLLMSPAEQNAIQKALYILSIQAQREGVFGTPHEVQLVLEKYNYLIDHYKFEQKAHQFASGETLVKLKMANLAADNLPLKEKQLPSGTMVAYKPLSKDAQQFQTSLVDHYLKGSPSAFTDKNVLKSLCLLALARFNNAANESLPETESVLRFYSEQSDSLFSELKLDITDLTERMEIENKIEEFAAELENLRRLYPEAAKDALSEIGIKELENQIEELEKVLQKNMLMIVSSKIDMAFQAAIPGVEKNGDELLACVFEKPVVTAWDADKKATVLKQLYIFLTAQKLLISANDPASETLDDYTKLLEEHVVKFGLKSVDNAIDKEVAISLINTINASDEANYVEHLSKEKAFSLLKMTTQFWSETPAQQESHSAEDMMLNLSRQHLASGELQMNLVQRLSTKQDLSIAESVEIYTALLITDFQQQLNDYKRSPQFAVFSALRLLAKGFIRAIDDDMQHSFQEELEQAERMRDDDGANRADAHGAERIAMMRGRVVEGAKQLWDQLTLKDRDPSAEEQEGILPMQVDGSFQLLITTLQKNAGILAEREQQIQHEAQDNKLRLDQALAIDAKNEAAKLRAKELKEAELALEQERREQELQQEATKQQAELDVKVTAASVFRRYFTSLAERVQYSREARDQVSVSPLVDTFFSTHHQAAHAQLNTQQTEVFVPAGVMRKVFPLEQMERSVNVHETLLNPVIAAESRSRTLKREEGAINYVKDNESFLAGTKSTAFTPKMTEKLGCYTEQVTAEDQYQIAIHQLPATIMDRAVRIVKACNVDESKRQMLEDMFKQYKEPMATENGMYHFLREQELLKKMDNKQLQDEAENLVKILRQQTMIQVKTLSYPAFIPNDQYLKFVNAQVESFVSAVGVKGKMYIYDYPEDPLITMSFILLCEARNIPYVNKSTLSYEPRQTEVKGAREWLIQGSPNKIEKDLQELQELRKKIGNDSNHIDELEGLIKKVGAGTVLTKPEEERVLAIIQETEHHPNFKASGG